MTGVWITAIICLTILIIVALGAWSASKANRTVQNIFDEELNKWPRR